MFAARVIGRSAFMTLAVRPTTSEPRRMESAPAPTTPALDLEPPMLDASAGGPAGSLSDSTRSTSLAAPEAQPAQKRGRSLWALADQILISGTNFVTMVLVARGLDPAGFGAFNLVYGALLF